MRKGISLPVEFVVIIGISVLVLIVVIIFFFTAQGSATGSVNMAQAQAQCGSTCLGDMAKVGDYYSEDVSGIGHFDWTNVAFCNKEFVIEGETKSCTDIRICTLSHKDIEGSSSNCCFSSSCP